MNKKYISILLLIIVLFITLSLGSYRFINNIRSDKAALLPSIIQNKNINEIPISIMKKMENKTTPSITK
jgi:hypothetical protein